MLNRGQILDEALSQIGRKDLKVNARLWLNLFLDKIYRTQDFEWLVKNSGLITLTDGATLPSDYRGMKTALLYKDGNYISEVETLDAEQWFLALRENNTSGAPKRVYLDLDTRRFRFVPAPDATYQWRYAYYYIPELPDHTNSASDLEEVKWGLAEDILIRAVQAKGLYYNDDQRYQSEIQEIMKEIVEGKMNSGDKRAGRNKLKFGKSFQNRRG